MSTPTPPRFLSEPDALALYIREGIEAPLEACADYHRAHGTSPHNTPLLVEIDVHGRVCSVSPADAAVTALNMGVVPPPVRPPPEAPRTPAPLPREAVAHVIIALRAVAPNHPALASLGAAAAGYNRLVEAVRAAATKIEDATVRTELLDALAGVTSAP